jgi:hypothetical protein
MRECALHSAFWIDSQLELDMLLALDTKAAVAETSAMELLLRRSIGMDLWLVTSLFFNRNLGLLGAISSVPLRMLQCRSTAR